MQTTGIQDTVRWNFRSTLARAGVKSALWQPYTYTAPTSGTYIVTTNGSSIHKNGHQIHSGATGINVVNTYNIYCHGGDVVATNGTILNINRISAVVSQITQISTSP